MNPTLFLRPKGIATSLYGLLLVLAPVWFMSILGADINSASETMIRLLGLPLVVIGYEMYKTPKDVKLDTVESILYVIVEVIAIALVFYTTSIGVFNALGYILGVVYIVSGIGFLYCLICAVKYNKS